jgi:hypothetical protein
LQTGETCSITNTTRAARRSTNFKVVTRRPFGPLVEIQLRVERKGSTFGPSDPGAGPAEGEEPAAVEEEEPVELALVFEETDGSVDTAVPPAEGACTGLAAAGGGVASVEVVVSGTTADVVVVRTGSVGSGSGTVGTVVMVGTGGIGGIGGMGTGSASA